MKFNNDYKYQQKQESLSQEQDSHWKYAYALGGPADNLSRKERRRRKRLFTEFGKKVSDKFWWDSQTDSDKYAIYKEWVWEIGQIQSVGITKFLEKIKEDYPGDKGLMRESKLEHILK